MRGRLRELVCVLANMAQAALGALLAIGEVADEPP